MDTVTQKPRLATVWLGGCSGCHMSFLDLDERLIELGKLVEVCASPITDYKDFPEVDITLVEGAVANEDHLETVHLIRKRSKIVIAFGDCAVTGNVTAMRNQFGIEDVLNTAYRDNSTVIIGIPEGNGVVPKLLPEVRPVHEVIEVNYFLQGCPPDADAIYQLVSDLLAKREPALSERRFG